MSFHMFVYRKERSIFVNHGPGCSVGCASTQYSDGRGFEKHYFVEIGHGIISTAILSLPLLSVTGERMCPMYLLGVSLP